MKLEQQIEEELKKIGRVDTMPMIEGLCYYGRLKMLMLQYQKENKGKFYVPPNCETCEKYNEKPTGAKGWGSVL